MSDILAKIEAYKREEIAAAKIARPLGQLEREAKAAPPPRGFPQGDRAADCRRRLCADRRNQEGEPVEGPDPRRFRSAVSSPKPMRPAAPTCLSVLTDGPSFQGKPEFLGAARNAAALPVLRKDFIYEPYQVVESRALGADCILIIMAAVDDAAAKAIEDAAFANGMDVLLEVHQEDELERALRLKSRLIGINNRDLRTFKTSLAVSEQPGAENPARPHRGRRKRAQRAGRPCPPRPHRHFYLPGRRKPDASERRDRRNPRPARADAAHARRRSEPWHGLRKLVARRKKAARRPKTKAKRAPLMTNAELTHIDPRGQARMVDVSAKNLTERLAIAEGRVIMRKETLDLVLAGNAMKGDVLGAARLAGIMAAKRTHGLIPLCHPLPITKVEIDINPEHALPGFECRRP